MPSKEYQAFYQKLLAKPSPTDLPIDQIRPILSKFMEEFSPQPDIRFEPCTIGSIPASWTLAPQASRKKVILYFHGGGYNVSSVQSERDLIGRLSRATSLATLAIDYRLAPENPFPAAVEDALSSFQFLLKTYSPADILLCGISAGAGLALALCLKLKQENLPQPAAALCLCPWVDLTLSMPSIKNNTGKDWLNVERLKKYAKNYSRGENLNHPLLSPYHGDLQGLPPLLIQTSTGELFYDESVALAKKAQSSAVPTTLETWPELIHAWQLFASKFPEGQEAIDHVGKYIKNFLKTPH